MTVKKNIHVGRFSSLLQGPEHGTQACDRPLYSHADWVAAPTLGAIVPNWLIVVPREHALSFRSWWMQHGKAPEAIIEELCGHLGLALDEVIWFEHGPAVLGSVVGCGTDHAHIHIILRPSFTFEAFLNQAISMSQLKWAKTAAERAYTSLPNEPSYLMLGSGDQAAWASDVDATGSQFLRRVINSLTDQAERWDYRRYSHADNIGRTIDTFRSLESTARRGG